MTEQQLRAVTIGELRRIDGPVSLVDYDTDWPRQFEREKKRIKAALGERALQIEHVGSTAVPGLIAKPIIDLLLLVIDSADEPAYVPPLESQGYVLRIREPDWHQHRLFKGPDTSLNLHVFSFGSDEAERMLAFRDRLRSSPTDRDRYADAKKSLARQSWKYVQNYADAKSEIVRAILARGSTSRA